MRVNRWIENHLYGNVSFLVQDRFTLIFTIYLLFVLFLGVVGQELPLYGINEPIRDNSGSLLISEPPSLDHPLGTTTRGNDVFSRVVYGARPTIITGAIGGTIIITVGTSVGLVAGYVGGRTDDLLMRFTDLVYGVPLIPFAIVLVGIFSQGYLTSAAIIGVILWRGCARVIRSQVLEIRERPFVLSAKAGGASTPRIMWKHILPNIAPMAMLFFAIGVGSSILIQAGLTFLGLADPFTPSWGVMIRNAYASGSLADRWWWALPPGIMISMTVLSTFIIGRKLEEIFSGSQSNASLEAM